MHGDGCRWCVRVEDFFFKDCLVCAVLVGLAARGFEEIRAEPCSKTASCVNGGELATFQAWS